MGQLRFYVAESDAPPPHWERAQFLNSEGLPYRLQARWEAPYLILDRADTDSGYLLALWSSAQQGLLALASGTLIERPGGDYILPLELARGTLNRLRNHAALWQMAGMALPDELRTLTHAATQWLARAATAKEDPALAVKHAQLALELALQGIQVLTTGYARQSAVARQRQTPQPLLLVGAQLPDLLPHEGWPPALLEACNAVGVATPWRSVEVGEGEYVWTGTDRALAWCQAQNLRIVAGPLVDLGTAALPDWLALWEDDFDNLLAVTADYITRVVTRYRGRVQIWNAAAKINTTPAWPLSEEQRLRLAVRILEVIRELDPRTPMILTLDQPAGEGLAERGGELTPWHFADALCRAELGLAGIGLEYNFGPAVGQSLPRDTLALCQQLDLWSMLNLPVILFLQNAPGGPASPLQQQRQWLMEYGPVLLGKQVVQGLFWNTLQDPAAANLPPLGLLNSHGQPKPILGALVELRQKFGN